MSTFHLYSGNLSDYCVQCICLPAPWKYTLIYWLSKHASSYGALLSATHPHGARYPLSRCFAAVAQSADEFSAFSTERESFSRSPFPSSSYFPHVDRPYEKLARFLGRSIPSRFCRPPASKGGRLASNPTRHYGNLFTSRILSPLYRRGLAPILLGFNDAALDLILKCNDWSVHYEPR